MNDSKLKLDQNGQLAAEPALANASSLIPASFNPASFNPASPNATSPIAVPPDAGSIRQALLQRSWARCCEGLGAFRATGGQARRQEVFEKLCTRYSEPTRKYHSMQHLRECITHFEDSSTLARQPAEVEMALWFHDAIYELGARDNEAASARWAEAELLQAGVAREAIDRVLAMIMATLHSATPSDADERLLVDIDLSILGANEARFQEYENQIREEYAFVPEPLFRQKRGEILRSFLERPRIYNTPFYFEKLERIARSNLGRVI
jgi:predicted metal-dependent HD superfamily phosphohydrolase